MTGFLSRRFNRQLVWIGHRYNAAMTVVFGYSIPAAFLCWYMHWNASAQMYFQIPLAAGFLVVTSSAKAHDNSLCEHCYSEMPLNPGELAETRYRPWLKREHWIVDHSRLLLATGASFLLGCFLAAKYAPFLAVQLFVLVGIAAANMLSRHNILHKKYYPWCPYCDHGHGGEYMTINNPTPSGVSQ